LIRVSVFLLSAISADRNRELARMDIANDGTSVDVQRGNYRAMTLRGRTTADLNKGTPGKMVELQNWPREALHVWNLVAALLKAMGYDKMPASVTTGPALEAVPVLVGYLHTSGYFQPIATAHPQQAAGAEPVYKFVAQPDVG